MSNEIEMMNNEVITETVEEVVETAKKSDNKFVKGFVAGIATAGAAIAGIKYVLKPVITKFKANRAAKKNETPDDTCEAVEVIECDK